MLSNADLKPHYDKVTWLFVTRNFKGDEADREAARTHDRFGITSWPQIPLFDPRDDRVLAWLPRDLRGFVAGLEQHEAAVPKAGAQAQDAAAKARQAVELRRAGKLPEAAALLAQVAAQQDEAGIWLHARELQREWSGTPPDLAAMLADPDVRQRAIAVEAIADLPPGDQQPHAERLRALLGDGHESLVVRLRAVRLFARNDPAVIAAQARSLLAVANDPFRFEVLTALAEHPDPTLVPTLLDLFDGAGGRIASSNPNVLRIHAARCLGGAGDERAVAPLAAVAAACNTNNGLTWVAIDALAAIGERHAGAVRQQVVDALRGSFPPALEDAGLERHGERAGRMARNNAQRVFDALERVAAVPPLPQTWTREDRARYLRALVRVEARR